MADVTVNDLAKSVGASVERLLSQMGQAGLAHKKATDMVSDEEKQTLLAFLKTQHGESAEAPRKITLKRKTTTTIKTGTGSARKTVNVEVRKKRTYVKRTDLEGDAGGDQDLLQDAEELLEIDNEQATFEAVEAEVPAPVAEIAAPEVSEEAPQATEAEAAPAQPRVFVDDAENRRQAAILARQNATKEADALARKAAEERRKKDEAKKLVTKKPTAAPVLSAEELAAKAEEEKHKLSKKKERTIEIPIEEEEDSRNRHNKKAGKAVKKTAVVAPKKGSAVLTYLDEDNEFGGPRGHRKGGRKLANKHGFKKPTSKIVHEVEIPESITVSELASRMSVKGTEVVKHLMKMGVMASLNQVVDQDTAHIVVADFGHQAVLVSHDAVEHNFQRTIDEQDGEYVTRAPIITVMGHVDHGKTSLLDYIRKAKVAAGEAGGITQHIGAYRVPTSHGELTFLDTPGHAAFTAMRARGARCTDVVILVVAADDGVMPQTEEAIKHAKAAGVPMVVAINKCDKPSADPDRVKNELVVKDVIPDDWGGDTQFVQVSALTGDGVDQLLEAVAIQAELLELNAQINVPGRGVVIESRMDKGRGVVATLLVQNGELKTGDMVLAGQSFGRVRAMVDEHSAQIKAAGPSMPVEILGLDVAPNAGDEFAVVSDERKAREVSEFRAVKEREERMARTQVSKLENMFANIAAGEKKTLSVVVKTDVRGSLEAINAALLELGNSEVEVRIVGDGVGGITENDINLAMTTRAIVVGFNVRADGSARKLAEREGVDIRYYSIIYQLIDEVKAALSGMLDPERVETILGIAQVRDTFRSPKFGQVAGCMVLEGTVYRNKRIRVLRDNVVIFEGELESLRRFKDDVAEVRHGMECGIGVKNYEVKVGDQIEVYEVKEVARSL
ncbi:MAG TPA: translation initiation factor IF-2 [Marinagarivorans sp.]|nr:translation initiation factor IF-2 [Marinagarivorans sp.]HNG59709.1 translation initiation factor IF-2 [Cellvibrionaceae bacterium]